MKKTKKILIILTLLLIVSCTKESLTENNKIVPQKIYVHNGILVFDTKESFVEILDKINKMSIDERENWEEKLGFKSFDRTISEIFKDQFIHQERISAYSIEELEILVKNGEVDEFSPMIKEYIKKGIIEIVLDDNDERNLNINSPMYSSLVNIDGFVAIGNEILQYTKNRFKVIKSLDFSKIEDLKEINENINNENFFVTRIIVREKVTIGNIFSYTAESFTTDRQKVVATETYQYYDRYYDGIFYEANYTLEVVNRKKFWSIFGWYWAGEYARTWVWGDFDIEAKDILNGKENVPFSHADENILRKTYTLINKKFSKFDYLNSDKGGPKILRSTLNVSRWGGPHGLGVRLIDHIRYERF